MSTNILGNSSKAAFYCNTEMRAFGPVFESEYHAVKFREWLDDDPRTLYNEGVLGDRYREWVQGD